MYFRNQPMFRQKKRAREIQRLLLLIDYRAHMETNLVCKQVEFIWLNLVVSAVWQNHLHRIVACL